jgi:pimeloyl-ACP methyl ester carboxylesterase
MPGGNDSLERTYWQPYPGVRRTFVDGPDGQLHVRVKVPASGGSHPPLYGVHQSPSSSVALAALVAEMGKDRPSAAGDTPGFGESDPPTAMPSIEDYATAHLAILDALNWSAPIDLFGFFTGSKIVLAMARAQPDRFRRLILLGAPLYTCEELASERTTYRPDEYDWDGEHLMQWWRHLKAGAPEPHSLSLFARHFAEIQRAGPESWWGHRAAFAVDLCAWLPEVTHPVLVICSDDPQGAKSAGAVDLLPQGQRLNLPYPGQALLDLHTDEVCGHLRAFLDT